jgi:hypothetical protein
MADWRLLEAAQRNRQAAQMRSVSRVHLDAPDSWAIAGPSRCTECGAELALGTIGQRCEACDPETAHRHIPGRPRKQCGIDGCRRKARSNGRCRKHLQGDDEWYGWSARAVLKAK